MLPAHPPSTFVPAQITPGFLCQPPELEVSASCGFVGKVRTRKAGNCWSRDCCSAQQQLGDERMGITAPEPSSDPDRAL